MVDLNLTTLNTWLNKQEAVEHFDSLTDLTDWLFKAVSAESVAEAKRRGLVPQSGDWEKPRRWVLGEDADVVEELGREGEIALLTSDGGPASLEAILQGKYVGSFGQQLPTQGPWAYEILYNYNEYGMWPVRPIVTGPALIDASNAQQVKDVTVDILGEDEYYKASPY